MKNEQSVGMDDKIKMITKARENLSVAYGVFEFRRQILVQLMSDFTDFEIDIIWQLGDGFVVLDIDSGLSLVPLDTCIRIIEEHGKLTRDEFKNHRI